MNKIKILLFIFAIFAGILMFVYAEIDDSPGGQMLGLLAVIAGIIGLNKKQETEKIK